MDNHFPESWDVQAVSQLVSRPLEKKPASFSVFPNPARDRITIIAPGNPNQRLEIYNLSGQCLGFALLDQQGGVSLNLEGYPPGLLFLKLGTQIEKVVLLEN